MSYLRYHWFDLAIALAIALSIGLYIIQPSGMTLVLWLSLGSLFLHQIEEWRFPGYFPGMLNSAMFNSDLPDRYPLNANSGMIVNVFFGWGGYLLAALFWHQAIWLAFATILMSIGNIVAHTIIFNIKGKTLYNPGLITSWLFFAPIVYLFFDMVITEHLATPLDWIIGLVLGAVINYFCVYKMIVWLADRNTPYVFPRSFLK
ncbi:HXXEE domain-containing protein [Polynucleobacter sp. AP-Feld-500C-C5]|uniref:HXXEE domain-containing protein n=1 Tax=Polynucleobacter sp. AP-Feld-500C-C5 TaxID=2576924 RepID=UPI001C0C7386|nr:HXXEE domain-containing protein [Polynucleobacter sp. AP-Feld-500C-C5]MBU3631698.1 HXXEE domain-containing protein [Polynucleobacter sp. AP-Feld-500C-C5]